MTSSTKGGIAARSHGWSPELLTLLGAMLAIGVGLAGLMFSFQGQVREDIRAVETRLREEMKAMETRLISDLDRRESRIREDVRELRGDVGELRERVSHIEGRFVPRDTRAPRPSRMPETTAPS